MNVKSPPFQQLVTRAYEEALDLAPGTAGAASHFFGAGGDSLRGHQLLARLAEETGAELTIEDLFAAPTVAALAARLEEQQAADVRRRAPSSGSSGPRAWRGRAEPLPLTSPQRRLWFLDRLEPGGAAYNLGLAVRLTGPLDEAALTAALTEIVRRHESLRTVFRVNGGAPVQVVLPAAAAALPLLELSALPLPAAAADGVARDWARRPFDLERGPPFRACLVRLAAAEHELLAVLHHIISDAWSLAVLLREIGALYGAAVARRPSPLAEPPMQFGDFAAWQQERRGDPALAVQLDAWRQRLAGAPPVHGLPVDRSRPPVRSDRGAHSGHPLPPPLAAALQRLAADWTHGVSLFMVLLAGFQALVARLSGQPDIVVGTAIANRDRVELEGLIGLFVNTLPLRTGFGGDPTFAELLQRVRAVVLAAFAGREVPFERLVDELRPERDLSHTPLVQLMLVLQSAPLAVSPPAGLGMKVREIDNGTVRFDLALSVVPDGGALATVWKYSRDLFDAATVHRLAASFERLLAAAAADPGRRLSELPLLGAAERHQLTREWNATAAIYPQDIALHQLFEMQVERIPDQVAVVCGDQRLTYQQLDRRANRLARHLRRLGVGSEVLVGIAAERSPELMVGLLGTLKAGGAYLPLDPAYPAERLAFMIEDAAAPVLLTQESVRRRLPSGRARLLCLDADWQAVAAEGEASPAAEVLPGHLAYVIYTSGSTGRPKGAMITHHAIVNRLLWMQEAYGLLPGEGVLQKTPISFDVSVWELFWPLAAGAQVVLARPGGQQDTTHLADLIAGEQVTTLHFVPSMLGAFLEEPRFSGLGSLRRVVVSGEALPAELSERFEARRGGAEPGLHNLYGPTEAAVDVTAWPCGADPRESERGVPIGRPIANLAIHLLDGDGGPSPIGVPGHLHIGGAGLARGYLRRPELTAERFVPDAAAGVEQAGSRLYATGDLARFRHDGAIEFLGRLDHQVKIRGVRIELGEIEDALARHPAVREAVVTLQATRLAAYVVGSDPAAPPTAATLAAWLAARLPEPMLPAAYVTLDAMPRNPSGKVDRRRLPAPAAGPAGAAGPAAHVAPRTPVERRLAALWSELLGGGEASPIVIGVDDNFFALGGDSIQGALLVNRLQRELGAIVYVMALFDHPTVAGLAAHLEAVYGEALTARGWLPATPAAALPVPGEASAAADRAALLAQVAARFSRPPRRPAAARNPPALFLLSPFRSGSTLLRVMLAGHPRLFAPPELELLGFDTLGERQRTFSGRDSFSREGLLRAVMELRRCDADAAAALVGEAEERDEPAALFYARLQSWAGGRMLVDKTPRYALDLATLEQAESWFDEPLYVHLVRHPAATIHSYLEARMDQVYRLPLAPRRQAEMVWRISHENILAALAAVPAARQHRLCFEEMVREPRAAMADLCRFLGLAFHPGMLSPYAGGRMTDGIRQGGRMMGDPKFHQHRRIDEGVADGWRRGPAADNRPVLTAASWRLAARLGFGPPPAEPDLAPPAPPLAPLAPLAPMAPMAPIVPRGAAGGEVPLSFTQQRLWFLDRLEPGTSAYNMPATVRLTGRLAAGALAGACAEIERRHQVLRTTFATTGGRPRPVVREPRGRPLALIDLGSLPERRRRAEARRLAGQEARRPYDLAAGPLWRTCLLRLAGDEHLMLVNFHHIAADGWSIGVLTRELAALYAAAAAGCPSPLLEPVLQYSDFAVWQRAQLTGGAYEELVRYWRERLAAPLPVLELPTDRPRPTVQTHRGCRLPLELEPRLVAALRALGAETTATLFMVLIAGFQTVLLRHTGQDDLVVGTPVAGRNRAELEGLIGPFVNTLALRCSLAGDPAVGEILGRVRQTCLEGFRHQDLPFEKLVEELAVERSLGHSPLFAAMLALQNAPPPPLALPGLALERLAADSGTAKFDLTVDLAERRGDGALAGAIEYNTDLFDRATMARLGGHLVTMLAGFAAAPGARLSALPLLAAAERQQLACELNDHAEPFAGDTLIHELFAATARRVPGAVAVSCDAACLTYGALAADVQRLARLLARLGVGPEVVVGLYAERSPALLTAVLAVLSAGGAYLPLDPTNPPARVADILADSGTGLLLSERTLAAALPAHAARVVLLDEAPAAGEPAPPLQQRATPESLAYVIYTSGSTGRPKGVELRHRGVVNYLASMARRPGLGESAVMVALTTLSFDIAVTELLLPLAVGARIELVRRETAGDAARLAAVLEAVGATIMQATPTTWTLLLDSGWAGRDSLVALCGGEALPPGLAARLLPRVGALWNVYGPTETTVWSTLHRVTPAAAGARQVAVGQPLANTTVELLDGAGNLAPLGVTAELAIGGLGLARGYRGRPDLTAERFIPDASGGRRGEVGARLYRTGDLARRRPDGVLECLGRLDSQVKVRGVRIELGEIEAAAASHPAVRRCVAGLMSGERPADSRLVAWVLRAPDARLSWEELRAFLLERLPAAMVPAAAVFLEQLPLLPSGKIDRRGLPEPGHDRPDLAASYVSPQNERERVIAQLWQEALGLSRVGIHDNFFDLGGHSLLAAEIHGRLRERLDADLPLVDLFRYPTVHALAARLGGEAPAAPLAGLIAQSGEEREALRRRRRGLAQRRQPVVPRGAAP